MLLILDLVPDDLASWDEETLFGSTGGVCYLLNCRQYVAIVCNGKGAITHIILASSILILA